ncbi:MAG: hypothetical protein LBD02_09950 [Christensenellaceae bacterium]|jgi:hypothetical protein|nr:hypothetical protein [Christensenellaceae bacterium]
MEKRLISAISTLRLAPQGDEFALQDEVAKALTKGGVEYRREVRLGPAARVDFLCGNVALEVKRVRPARAALLRQLARYAAFDEVASLIVVSEKSLRLPPTVGGKPLHVLALSKLWGVAI